jgi:capsid protein
LGYDATNSTPRRRPPTQRLLSEDNHLPPRERRKLVSTTRDLNRNFTLSAWAIRKHLDYVSTFTYQAKTGDKQLDADLETLMTEANRAENFDVAGRHSQARFIRLTESCRTVDGDLLVLPMAGGQFQAIEGDRVTNPNGFATGQDAKRFEGYENGVKVGLGGKALSYIVCKRAGALASNFEFEAFVDAAFAYLHGYFTRFDQVRGISPLATAINEMQDIREAKDYALAKMKVTQLFALAIYRQFTEQLTSTATQQTDDDPDDDDATSTERDIDFSRGPILLDLEDNEKAEFLESHSPSSEFLQFTTAMMALALKALDIPFSFYDEAHTNYSGARQAWLQYEQSADTKRADNLALLGWITRMQYADWILSGKLVLPRSYPIEKFMRAFEHIPTAMPWIDPLKEVTADLMAVEGRLDTRSNIVKRRSGRSFPDVISETAADEKEAADARVQLPVMAAKGVDLVAATETSQGK